MSEPRLVIGALWRTMPALRDAATRLKQAILELRSREDFQREWPHRKGHEARLLEARVAVSAAQAEYLIARRAFEQARDEFERAAGVAS